MKTHISLLNKIVLTTFLLGGFVSHGIAQSASYSDDTKSSSSAITETSPAEGERDVDLDSTVEVTFNKDMDTNSLNQTTFLLREHATNADSRDDMQRNEMRRADESSDRSAEASENRRMRMADTISGTIDYSDKVAVFTPDSDLKEGTRYTVNITTGAKDSENIALENDRSWSFTTRR